MWALVGHYNDIYQERIGAAFLDHPREEIVALFHEEAEALAFIERYRLKNPRFESFLGWRRFRSDSLLATCEDAHVEPYIIPDYPVDPK